MAEILEEVPDVASLELGLGKKPNSSVNGSEVMEEIKVTYLLRDIKTKMVVAWEKHFNNYGDRIKVQLHLIP